MTVKLYVVRDRIAAESGPIFEAKNDGVARRNYERSFLSQDVDPDEFRLLCVGVYNRDKTQIEVYDIPREIIPTLDEELEDDGE
jgi:hypothetical protein